LPPPAFQGSIKILVHIGADRRTNFCPENPIFEILKNDYCLCSEEYGIISLNNCLNGARRCSKKHSVADSPSKLASGKFKAQQGSNPVNYGRIKDGFSMPLTETAIDLLWRSGWQKLIFLQVSEYQVSCQLVASCIPMGIS
jgi:hypothetical protein